MTGIATTRNLTVLGIAMIVQSLATAATFYFDGDPDTVVDFAGLINAVIVGIGMILAKGASTTGVQSIGGKPVA